MEWKGKKTKNQQHSDKHDIISVYGYSNLHARSRFLAFSFFFTFFWIFSRENILETVTIFFTHIKVIANTYMWKWIMCVYNIIDVFWIMINMNIEYIRESFGRHWRSIIIIDSIRFSKIISGFEFLTEFVVSDIQISLKISFIYLFGVGWVCASCLIKHVFIAWRGPNCAMFVYAPGILSP